MVERSQHRLDPSAREAGPGRHGEPRQPEHGIRLLPGEEFAELVGADHEERVVELAGAKQVDRARVRIETDVVVRERGPRQLEARLRR